MAIALVQTAAIGSTAAGTSQQTGAFASNPTVGNYLVAWAWGWGSNTHNQTPAFSDTAGNTWTVPANSLQQVAVDLWVHVGYAKVTATGATFKVTSNSPMAAGGGSIMVVAAEFSGVASASPLDGAAVGTTGTTGVPAPGSLTLTAGDLVVAVMSSDQTTYTTFGYGTPTGFSRAGFQNDGSTFQVGEGIHAINPSSPSNPSYKTGTVKWAAAQFALLAASGGGTAFTKSLTGSLTASSAIVKRPGKGLAGTLAASATIARSTGKALSGSLTASATLARSAGKALSGSLAPAGTLARRAGKALAGSVAASGSLAAIRTILRSFSGSLAASGTLTRSTGKALSGSLTSAGSLARRVAKALAGSLAAAGSLSRSTGGTGSLRTGLLAYYKMDEASGNALDAFNTFDFADNGSVGTAAGVLNSARSFNGTTQYLSLAGGFGFGATSGSPFSVSGWAYSDDLAGNHIIFGRYDGTHLIQLWSGGSNFFVSYGVSPFNNFGTGTVSTGTWYHLAFTFSTAGVGKLYLNGSLQATDSSPTGDFTSTVDLNIGRRGGDGNSPFAGRIDELGLWSRELTASEVSALYGGGTPPALATFGGTAAFLRSLAGSLASSATLARSVGKALSGSLASAGSLAKQAGKALAGSLAASATLARRVARALSGSLTPAGSLAKQAGKALAGTLAASGSLTKIRAFLRSFSGTLTASATLSRQAGKSLSGTLAASAALARQAGKSLSGTLAASGSFSKIRAVLKSFAGTLAASGAPVARRTGKALAGTLAASGATTRAVSRSLAGSLAASATLARSTRKGLSGTLAASGTLSRAIAKALAGILVASASFVARLVAFAFSTANHPDPARSVGRRLGPDASKAAGSRLGPDPGRSAGSRLGPDPTRSTGSRH